MAPRTLTADELRKRGLVVGTGNELVDQLPAFANAGGQRLMLQELDLHDMDGLEGLATGVLTHVL